LKTFRRLRQRRDPTGTDELPLWGGALFVGFAAQLVSAFFLTMGYSIFFTLFFAVAASLRQMGGEQPPEIGAAAPRGVRRAAPKLVTRVGASHA
jgi:hypothetical protein